MNIKDLVVQYLALRDRRARRKQAFTEDDAKDASLQAKIEGVLLKQYDALGMESVSTEYGTAYKALQTSATVADKQVFLEFCLEDDAKHLMDIRASKTAIAQYKEVHGLLPPGINWRAEYTINVRRS